MHVIPAAMLASQCNQRAFGVIQMQRWSQDESLISLKPLVPRTMSYSWAGLLRLQMFARVSTPQHVQLAASCAQQIIIV